MFFNLLNKSSNAIAAIEADQQLSYAQLAAKCARQSSRPALAHRKIKQIDSRQAPAPAPLQPQPHAPLRFAWLEPVPLSAFVRRHRATRVPPRRRMDPPSIAVQSRSTPYRDDKIM